MSCIDSGRARVNGATAYCRSRSGRSRRVAETTSGPFVRPALAALAVVLALVGVMGCKQGDRASSGPLPGLPRTSDTDDRSRQTENETATAPQSGTDATAASPASAGIDEAERFRSFRARLVQSTLPAPVAPKRGAAVASVTSVRIFSTEATTGGTHHALAVQGDQLVQSFGSGLLLLDARNGRTISSIEIGPLGAAGPIVDVLFDGDRLYAVLERDAVAALTISPAGLMSVTEIRFAEALGMIPRRVRMIGDEIWIFGEYGMVRWSDGKLVAHPGGVVTGAAHIGGRLAVAVNRRVSWVDEGISRHTASTIVEVPPHTGADAVIGHQVKAANRVAVLNSEMEETDSAVLEGLARRMRYRDDRLWVITDESVTHWRIREGKLEDRDSVRVLGARDAAVAGPNTLAISGSFGRSLYRISTERGQPGDEFFMAVREPSRLSRAITDGRRILAGGREGRWLYLIGSHAERTERKLEAFNPIVEAASTRWGRAAITGDNVAVVFADGVHSVRPFDGSLVACIGEVDGELWIGHETGIDLVGSDPDGAPIITARLRLDGPVLAIFQKWDAGGVYVAEFGGFGVARLVDTPLETLGIDVPAPPRSDRRSATRGDGATP